MNTQEQLTLDVRGEVKNFCPLYITGQKYSKLLVVQTVPENKFWYKDEEITLEELRKRLE